MQYDLFNNVSVKWNFVNGFDLLSASFAVYNSYKISSEFFQQEASIEKIDELAKSIGVTGIHVAIVLSTFNPLLLLSATISSAGTLVGLLNNPYKIYFRKVAEKYTVAVAVKSYDIDEAVKNYDIDNTVKSYDINNRDYI